MTKKLVSIICPVYNEQVNIQMFYNRLETALSNLRDLYKFEYIFTNNRSTDNTVEIISSLRELDKRVQLITFSRNFGYQASVLAGLHYAKGDASIVIDVDCEDPPEMIPSFIEKWQEGYDIVYGIRKKRQENILVQESRNFFYWLLNKVGDHEIIMNMAEFGLITKDVRQEILNNKSTFPFLRTEISYAGFNQIGINYIRQARQYGKTHYNFWGMAQFAVGGILSSSTFLLRLSAFIGTVLVLLNALAMFFEITNSINKAFEVIVILDLMYLVFFMATISIYIARIYKNGVQRPVFIVDKRYTFVNSSPLDEE
jgi:glycosyltransferase involved in cell wall biosynthesis